MRRYLNIRTLGLTLAAGAAVLIVYPDAVRYLPYLLLAACPLSMLFMHRRGGHAGHKWTASRQEFGEYVCPMHAEVRSTFLGDCPVCGMALEPATLASGNGTGQDGSHRYKNRRAHFR